MEQLKTREDLKGLFLRYSDEFYKYTYTRLGYNKETAEDTVQDLFIKAWDKRDYFDTKKGSIRTWLYAILRNLIIDSYRKKRPEVNSDEEPFIDNRIKSDNEILIMDSLNRLGERDKDLLALRYMQGLSNQEIAKIEGKSEGSVKVSVHRAMNKLRKIIDKKQ